MPARAIRQKQLVYSAVVRFLCCLKEEGMHVACDFGCCLRQRCLLLPLANRQRGRCGSSSARASERRRGGGRRRRRRRRRLLAEVVKKNRPVQKSTLLILILIGGILSKSPSRIGNPALNLHVLKKVVHSMSTYVHHLRDRAHTLNNTSHV